MSDKHGSSPRGGSSGVATHADHVKHITDLYINGSWIPSTGKEVVEVYDPTTAQVVATVPAGTPEDVDKAVKAARSAFVSWSESSLSTRADCLRKISEAINERSEEIALAAASDIGTPVKTGRYMHVKLPATTFANMADNIEKYQFETRIGFARGEVRDLLAKVSALAKQR